jgi:peptidoglycan/xylan/chitin deacetylase (PgdA/CDA1 family)
MAVPRSILAAMLALFAAISRAEPPSAGAQTSQHNRPDMVPILMYHHVGELDSRPSMMDYQVTVTADDFDAQINHIVRLGYTPITLDQLAAHFDHEAPLPDYPIVLTFDDGYDEHFAFVTRVLTHYAVAATFFVYTDAVGLAEHLSWDEMRLMQSAGMDIQSHTLTHPDLRRLDDDALAHELRESKRIIEHNLGTPVTSLAYPYGLYDARVEAAARSAGYRLAMTTDPGVTQRPSDRYRLRRIYMGFGQSIADLDYALGWEPGKGSLPPGETFRR